MRRSAMWGGILKLALYAVVLVIVPYWFYATYLAPIVSQLNDTYQQVQGTGAKAQAQFGDIQNFFKQFKDAVPNQ